MFIICPLHVPYMFILLVSYMTLTCPYMSPTRPFHVPYMSHTFFLQEFGYLGYLLNQPFQLRLTKTLDMVDRTLLCSLKPCLNKLESPNIFIQIPGSRWRPYSILLPSLQNVMNTDTARVELALIFAKISTVIFNYWTVRW